MEITYSQLMSEQKAHLTLKLDTAEPVELGEFVGAFTSLGNEFERFIISRYPDHKSDIQFFVREVRTGCIEAEMFAGLSVLAGVVSSMDHILILEDFIRRWGLRFRALVDGKKQDQPDTKKELKDFYDATAAIARDPKASHRLEAAVYEDGERKVRAAFKFSNVEAKTAQEAIADRKRELDKTSNADRSRVLMTFTRSDIRNVDVGKRSGERVTIPEISETPLALMYGSELAEQAIKSEIREADDNVYKKGFVVDVNVESRADGKPLAFSVTNLHQVIDLPDD